MEEKTDLTTFNPRKVLYVAHEWSASFDHMPDGQLGKLVKAMMHYSIDGREPEQLGKDSTACVMFEMVRPYIERGKQYYESRIEINRRNGSRGGRPAKASAQENCTQEKDITQPNDSMQSNDCTQSSDCAQNVSRAVAETASETEITQKNQSVFSVTENGDSENRKNPYINTNINKNRHTNTDKNTRTPPLPPPDGSDAQSEVGGEEARACAQKAQKISFDDFWKLYPRKQDKESAWLQWGRLRLSQEELAHMMAQLRLQSASEAWQRDSGRFVPMAEKYLKGRRWEDEILPPAAKSPGSTAPANADGFSDTSFETREFISLALERAKSHAEQLLGGESAGMPFEQTTGN